METNIGLRSFEVLAIQAQGQTVIDYQMYPDRIKSLTHDFRKRDNPLAQYFLGSKPVRKVYGKMRGILIDPFTQTISQVDYNGDYHEIYRLLSDPVSVDTFTAINIGERNTIWLDDNGLYQKDQQYFKYFGIDQPLAGKGLILATNNSGNSVETKLPIAEVQRNVAWATNVRFVGMVNKTPRQVLVPGLGKTTLFETEANFEEGPSVSADPNAN